MANKMIFDHIAGPPDSNGKWTSLTQSPDSAFLAMEEHLTSDTLYGHRSLGGNGHMTAELFDKDDNLVTSISGKSDLELSAVINPVDSGLDGDRTSNAQSIQWDCDDITFSTGKLVFTITGHNPEEMAADVAAIRIAGGGFKVSRYTGVGSGKYQVTIPFTVVPA